MHVSRAWMSYPDRRGNVKRAIHLGGEFARSATTKAALGDIQRHLRIRVVTGAPDRSISDRFDAVDVS